MLTTLLFILFGGLAVGCAVAVVAQRNPLYSAISLVGVFVALAGLYMTLSAPFIAAVQVIVYAGAIMVLVVFVIMLLNVEDEEQRPVRMRDLRLLAVALTAILLGVVAFMLSLRGGGPGGRYDPAGLPQTEVGLTASVGTGLFTEYLLPFEVTSVLILMALVGAITLARRTLAPAVAPEYASAGGASEYAVTGGSEYAPEEAGTAGVITPGDTAATGREIARLQIEQEDAERARDKSSTGGEGEGR